MKTKKLLIVTALVSLFLLGGCVATPYYGGSGYYRGAVYSSGYQPYGYYGGGYVNSYRPFYSAPRQAIGGSIHLHGGHRHGAGGHRNWGGQGHRGGHGRGHGGRH
ncbi:hypothetical protein [Nitrosomonas sp.]|uniref:hypothetical protein n=1 Tax=Nitrosomonas sp. TaxID=42353 RepID=UPI001D55B917|nr:hypothetical protein [Nitrosomonas sp.]MBX3615929.1 hypothetical protein [Nitrosomonas sp.]